MTMNDILGKDIDTCLEDFKKLPKGELVNLTQLLKIQYEQVSNLKNSLLVLIESHEQGENKMTDKEYKEHIVAVDNLYLSMQLIEDRFNIANELLQDLQNREQEVLEALK